MAGTKELHVFCHYYMYCQSYLQATDQDSGAFGTIWYLQATDSAETSSLFPVDRITGQIRLNGSFVSNSAPRNNSLRLLACDNLGEEPSLCSDVLSVKVYFVGDEHLVVITFASSIDNTIASLDEIQRY